MTRSGCNGPESHIQSKLPGFHECDFFFPIYLFIFFIDTCSEMTSADGSVVCPLRADMAQGQLFESVRSAMVEDLHKCCHSVDFPHSF